MHDLIARQGPQARMGHPSGTLAVEAEAVHRDGEWIVTTAIMSRSARRLMAGWVSVKADAAPPSR